MLLGKSKDQVNQGTLCLACSKSGFYCIQTYTIGITLRKWNLNKITTLGMTIRSTNSPLCSMNRKQNEYCTHMRNIN